MVVILRLRRKCDQKSTPTTRQNMRLSYPPLAMDHSSGSGSSSSSSSDRGPWLVSLLSFTAGALSTSFLWYMTRQHQQFDRSTLLLMKTAENDGKDHENGETNNVDENAATKGGRDSSEKRALSSSPTSFLKLPSMEDIKNQIGELPSYSSLAGARKRWPWDRIRRSNSHEEDAAAVAAAIEATSTSSVDNAASKDDGTNDKSRWGEDNDENADDANKDHDKSDICIGSIFGLDVGGSLAKLVYFECKAEAAVAAAASATSTTTSPRHMERPEERRSRAAAAAQAVLMARRGGGGTTSIDTSSNTTIANKDSTPAAATVKPSNSFLPQSFDDDEDEGEIDQGDYHNTIVAEEQEDVPKRARSQSFSPTVFQKYDQESAATTGSKPGKRQSCTLPAKVAGVGVCKNGLLRHVKNCTGHSKASEADLRKLYYLRQESVPANLHAYAESYPTTVAAAAEAAAHRKLISAKTNDDATATTANDSSSQATTASAESDDTAAVAHKKQGAAEEKEMPRANSMLNLSMNRDQKEALDRFYSFARRLDSYRDGVRDDKLSFYSRELGGDFHFIHFETRRMQHAMDLIRAHQLHKNISKMGATGGGAHRFAKDWQDQLGVAMDKQEELDSLVAGMQFTLSTVSGECYTFRPPDKMPPSAAKNGNNNPHEDPDQVDGAVNAASASQKDDDVQNVMNSPDGSSNSNPISSNQKGSHQSGAAPSIGRAHSSASSGSYGNYLGMDVDESDESSSSEKDEDDNAYVQRGRIDEWWWSHKVKRDAIAVPSSNYPYLLVTIGTGVSILRVDGPRKHERISGSTIGGGTYWGLIRLLTSVERFEDVLRLAERGDPSKCDMMVGDIYGNNPDALEKLGLPSNLVASSFGKLVAKEDPAEGLKEEDLARALLLMVTNNIGQVAYLNAQLYKTSRIYFVGNFLRQNRISQRRLSFAIDYWSKGQMEALFLEHEGYFGALGAFLLSQGIDVDKHGGATKQKKAPPTKTTTPVDANTAATRRKLAVERQRSRTIANFLHI